MIEQLGPIEENFESRKLRAQKNWIASDYGVLVGTILAIIGFTIIPFLFMILNH